MKKIFTLALFALATLTTFAQTKHTVNVWIDGQKTVVENVDSLTFTEDVKPTMEYVDLGLSVKWATCNLGAAKEDETGDYFSWGETAKKDDYSAGYWKFANGDKYNDEDNKLVLDAEDDAATAALGADWKTPNYDEMDELMNKCDWTWTTDKERAGYLVTSKENGNSIFLPVTGSIDEYGLYGEGKYVLLWTSERPTGKNTPYYLFSIKAGSKLGNTYAYVGVPIRPVYTGK